MHSDQTNPFTREPLSMEQVVPDTELKNRIESFVRDKMSSRQAAAALLAPADASAAPATQDEPSDSKAKPSVS